MDRVVICFNFDVSAVRFFIFIAFGVINDIAIFIFFIIPVLIHLNRISYSAVSISLFFASSFPLHVFVEKKCIGCFGMSILAYFINSLPVFIDFFLVWVVGHPCGDTCRPCFVIIKRFGGRLRIIVYGFTVGDKVFCICNLVFISQQTLTWNVFNSYRFKIDENTFFEL